jgi:hypothetical protein
VARSASFEELIQQRIRHGYRRPRPTTLPRRMAESRHRRTIEITRNTSRYNPIAELLAPDWWWCSSRPHS